MPQLHLDLKRFKTELVHTTFRNVFLLSIMHISFKRVTLEHKERVYKLK